MLLELISVKPELYQFRDTPWSEKTVAGIVAEGIDLAKFDPIPVVKGRGVMAGRVIVAGDGHSRFEACRRLADQNRLPEAWRVDGLEGEGWDVPTREVTEAEARKLAWTANLSRDSFNPAEEAKVYAAMLAEGMSVEDVAKAAQKSTHYVKRMLPLNDLCRDIREALAAPDTEGGIDKHIAQAMAERFNRYGIGPSVQQRLWHEMFKLMALTPKMVRETMDRIGPKLAGVAAAAEEQGLMFALPPSVTHAVREMKDRADDLRRATRGLAWLIQCEDSGILDDLAGLGDWVRHHGRAALETLKGKYAADADVLAQLVAA